MKSCRAGYYVGWALGLQLKTRKGVINLMGVNQGGPTGLNFGSILLPFQLPNAARQDITDTEPPESGGQEAKRSLRY